MSELNRTNGQTFVIVTHSMEVGDRAHRIVRMRDGMIESDQSEAAGSLMPTLELTPGDGAGA